MKASVGLQPISNRPVNRRPGERNYSTLDDLTLSNVQLKEFDQRALVPSHASAAQINLAHQRRPVTPLELPIENRIHAKSNPSGVDKWQRPARRRQHCPLPSSTRSPHQSRSGNGARRPSVKRAATSTFEGLERMEELTCGAGGEARRGIPGGTQSGAAGCGGAWVRRERGGRGGGGGGSAARRGVVEPCD